MRKFIKRLFAFLIIPAIFVCFINAKTDFFLNFNTYVPAADEYFPNISEKVSMYSEKLAMITDYIPSFTEIKSMIRNEEPPIDPADVATNAYIENSPMLTFYPKENIGITVDFDTVQIFGIVASRNKAHLIADFTDESGEELDRASIAADNQGRFNKTVSIPKTESYTQKLSIYTGSKEYGQFESWVYNYVTLERTPEGGWQLAASPVYAHNKAMYEKNKSKSDAVKYTASIQSNSSSVISIANQLTQGMTDNYDKILALHDWVCSYMYYDVDSLDAEETPPYFANDVIKSGKAVCLGFATLYASLCRAVDIPCNVVSGYALGISEDTEWTDETINSDKQNHAWNEAYVDGRWVIIDTTWDCTNKIENGEKKQGSGVSHIYFDANLQYFSANHKIIEYSKKR